MTPEELAREEERERCAKIVDGWYEFELAEGGVRLCSTCAHAGQIADAIRDPAKEAALKAERLSYMLDKERYLVEQVKKIVLSQ